MWPNPQICLLKKLLMENFIFVQWRFAICSTCEFKGPMSEWIIFYVSPQASHEDFELKQTASSWCNVMYKYWFMMHGNWYLFYIDNLKDAILFTSSISNFFIQI